MKCQHCPALRTEGYECPEEYCALGVSDNNTVEYKDGNCGCKRHSIDKIISDLKIQDEIEGQAFADIAELYDVCEESEDK